jgi:hypothetical protein
MNNELETVWKIIRVPVDQPSVSSGYQAGDPMQEEGPKTKKSYFYYELANPTRLNGKQTNPEFSYPVEHVLEDDNSELFFVPEEWWIQLLVHSGLMKLAAAKALTFLPGNFKSGVIEVKGYNEAGYECGLPVGNLRTLYALLRNCVKPQKGRPSCCCSLKVDIVDSLTDCVGEESIIQKAKDRLKVWEVSKRKDPSDSRHPLIASYMHMRLPGSSKYSIRTMRPCQHRKAAAGRTIHQAQEDGRQITVWR